MSARGSWIKRQAQRPEREEAAPGSAPARSTLMNAIHRCDRCGAQAYVWVLLRSHRELLFCGHHYRQHAVALATVAAKIQDETQRLARRDWPGARG